MSPREYAQLRKRQCDRGALLSIAALTVLP